MIKTWVVLLGVAATLATVSVSGCARPVSASPRPDKEVALDIRKKLASGATEATAGESAAAATGTGWGTLKGKFKFIGTAPSPTPLKVDKDTEVCGKGKGLLDNSLLVGSDGGIANIVVYAKAKRVNDSAKPLEEASASPTLFDQKECMFLSHVMACQVNQKVDIKNSDPVGHNTKIDPKQGASFNSNLPAGETVLYTPGQEEAYPSTVSCSVHPWMKAYILPRKDKYFAVTGPDGTFEIANLPAGEDVEIQVWHERGKGPNGGLALDNKELKWKKQGRFTVRLEPDQTKELNIDVPAAALQ